MSQISVIVPVYKVEQYLHHCVDSILAQSFTDFQLILVDDGSPDNCPEICDEYAKKDERVIVIHQKNGGLSAARNAGIDWVFANSASEWITFIDSDDWVHPLYLEILCKYAINSNTAVCVCGYLQTSDDSAISIDVFGTPTIWTPEEFFVKHRVNAIIAWAKLYKRECFAHLRFPIGRLHEDEFITYKILFGYNQICVTDEKLYYYRVNPNSITNSAWTTDRLSALEAQLQQILFFKDKNFIKALKHNTIVYLHSLTFNITSIDKSRLSNTEKAKLTKMLNKQKKHIYKQTRHFHSFKDDLYYYELILPKKVAQYWFFQSMKKKIKTIFGVKDANN